MQGSEPLWIPVAEVVDINRDCVIATGEPFGIRDMNLLESAVARPRMQLIYGDTDDILDLAVTLLFSIAKNHPFQQGNKRTGVLSALVFLATNGFKLDVTDSALLGELVVQVLQGSMEEQQFSEILRPFLARASR